MNVQEPAYPALDYLVIAPHPDDAELGAGRSHEDAPRFFHARGEKVKLAHFAQEKLSSIA